MWGWAWIPRGASTACSPAQAACTEQAWTSEASWKIASSCRRVPSYPGRKPYSTQVQQRHRSRTTPTNCGKTATCPYDHERPRCKEFASRRPTRLTSRIAPDAASWRRASVTSVSCTFRRHGGCERCWFCDSTYDAIDPLADQSFQHRPYIVTWYSTSIDDHINAREKEGDADSKVQFPILETMKRPILRATYAVREYRSWANDAQVTQFHAQL